MDFEKFNKKYSRDKIVKLRKDGMTFREIQKELDISSLSSIKHHLDQANFEFKSIAEIKEENIKLRKQNKLLINKIKKIWEVLKDKNIMNI